MAELTAKEKALSKYARLRELLETGDYDKLDPEEEYADAEEVEDELAGLTTPQYLACYLARRKVNPVPGLWGCKPQQIAAVALAIRLICISPFGPMLKVSR
jgi:hypothetical protein